MNNGWLTQRETYMSELRECGELLASKRIRLMEVRRQAKRSGNPIPAGDEERREREIEMLKQRHEKIWGLVQKGDAIVRARNVVEAGERELDLCRRISEAKQITVAPGLLPEFNASELMTLAAALTTFMKDIEVLNHDDSRDMYNAHRRNIEALINKFEDYANSRGM